MSDSPAKKLDFTSADKENVFKPIVGIPDIDDKEVKKALTQPNADRTLGDPEIVWCIGGTSLSRRCVRLL